MIPIVEMRWAGWRGLHPETRVVPGDLHLGRDYTVYPYVPTMLQATHSCFSPWTTWIAGGQWKERILGVPSESGDGGIAFPFNELPRLGAVAAIPYDIAGDDIVIL